MDATIDICSSDDSDFREIDEYCDDSPPRDSATPVTTQSELPARASESSSNATGYDIPSQKAPVLEQPSCFDKKSPNINGSASTGPRTNPFVRDSLKGSPSQEDHNNDYSQKVSSSTSGPLPSSFSQPFPGGRPNKLVDKGIASNSHDVRVQPSSQGKYSSAAPFQGSSDYLHQPGVGEEMAGDADERMVYQAALQDLYQPKAECNFPNGLLSVPLLRHQKIALSWMLQKETRGKPCFGGLLADDQKYAAAGTVNQNYANILLMLLRLRQACDHPLLAKGFSSGFVRKFSCEMVKDIPTDMVINLLECLSSAICAVCADPPEDAVVTLCGHVFCYQCVSDSLTSEDITCPASRCKELIGPDCVFTKPALKRRVSDDMDTDTSLSEFDEHEVLHGEYVSSKINTVIEILESHCKPKSFRSRSNKLVLYDTNASSSTDSYQDSSKKRYQDSSKKKYQDSQDDRPIKTIIFSQWTTMLDLLQISLDKSGVNYRRLDGTMSLPSRDKAVKEFNTNRKVTVMLMSLKAGNLGLNMVAACHVILLDLWWNPTTEDQAIDRAHRIGQTRPVTVSRLTIKDTVEDRILALQEEKRSMVASAFGEEHGGLATNKLTVEDLKYLFQV